MRLAGWQYEYSLKWYALNRDVFDFEPDIALDPGSIYRYAMKMKKSPILWARFKKVVSQLRNV